MRMKKMSALSLVLALGLAACSDSTGPGGEFDPAASAAEIEAMGAPFDTDVYNSLEVMGESFSQVGSQGAAAAAVLAHEGWLLSTARTSWEFERAGEAFVAALASSAGQVVLIPDAFRGRTYVYDPVEGYSWDPNRTGAPANGMRFILYTLDPVTKEPTQQEIGYVDVLDESNDQSGIARLIVVSQDVQYVNYQVSATLLVGSASFGVEGFITDGVTQVDLNLSASFSGTFASSQMTVAYQIDVPARGFSVNATMTATLDAESGTITLTIDATFEHNNNQVQLIGSLTGTDGVQDDGGTMELFVNGELFATITIQGQTITIVNAEGLPLSQQEAEAVERIFDGMDEILADTFEALFNPVDWLFNF